MTCRSPVRFPTHLLPTQPIPTQPIPTQRIPAGPPARTARPPRSTVVVAVAMLAMVVAVVVGVLDRGPAALALGAADGVVPDGVTVGDDVPAVANLDPGLLTAVRRAAKGAARAGVTFFVTSGWRSRAYQDQLLREAVSQYGSEAEAARWVATADTSLHVSGHAIDIGHSEATTWLSAHGAAYGLCQIYRNEPWHYELRPDAVDRGCPRMYADPTHDPRMQQ